MKKLALIFGLAVLAVACHTKEPQNQSGINDPINITMGDADSSVLNLAPIPVEPVAVPKPGKSATDTTITACIDSSKIDAEKVCTQEYKPVCGCDNKTYSNACMAEKAGVTKYNEGECISKEKQKEKAPANPSKEQKPKKKKK